MLQKTIENKFKIKKIKKNLEELSYKKIFEYGKLIFASKENHILVHNIETDRRYIHETDSFFVFHHSYPFLVHDVDKKGFVCYSGFFIDKEFGNILYLKTENSELHKTNIPFSSYEEKENYKEYEMNMLRKLRYIKGKENHIQEGINFDILPPLLKHILINMFSIDSHKEILFFQKKSE